MAFDVSYVFEAVNKFSPVADQVGKSLAGVQKQVTTVNDKMARLSSRMTSIGSSLRSVGKTLSLSVTAPLVGLAAYTIKNADNFAELNKMLIVTTGSAEIAAQALEKIKSMSMTTEFSPEELEGSVQRMMALGSTFDDAIKKTEMLSKVAEGSSAGLDAITGAYTRMSIMAKKSGGAIDSRSLVMLARQGIPVMAELQKMFAEHGKNLDKIMKAGGKIGFASVEEALNRIAQNKAADTLGEQMKILHNITRVYASDLGGILLDIFGIKGGMQGLIDYLGSHEKAFKAFLEAHKTLVKMIAIAAGVAAALAPIALILSVIATIMGLILSPFVLIGMAITAIGVGLYTLYKRSETFRSAISALLLPFKEMYYIVSKIVEMVKYLSRMKPQLNMNAASVGASSLMQQMKSPMMNAASMQHNVKSEMTVNIHDPNKYVQSVQATAGTKFNLGHSLAF